MQINCDRPPQGAYLAYLGAEQALLEHRLQSAKHRFQKFDYEGAF